MFKKWARKFLLALTHTEMAQNWIAKTILSALLMMSQCLD